MSYVSYATQFCMSSFCGMVKKLSLTHMLSTKNVRTWCTQPLTIITSKRRLKSMNENLVSKPKMKLFNAQVWGQMRVFPDDDTSKSIISVASGRDNVVKKCFNIKEVK